MPRFSFPSITRAQALAGDPPSIHLGEGARDEFGAWWVGQPDGSWAPADRTDTLAELGAILLRGEDEAEQASIYPLLIRQLTTAFAQLTLELNRRV
jgi:hypothetical protein